MRRMRGTVSIERSSKRSHLGGVWPELTETETEPRKRIQNPNEKLSSVVRIGWKRSRITEPPMSIQVQRLLSLRRWLRQKLDRCVERQLQVPIF